MTKKSIIINGIIGVLDFQRKAGSPENASEIEVWLRDQWSGLFRELLNSRANQKELSSLSTSVGELGEINKTLKHYLETVIEELSPKESKKVFATEEKRLEEARKISELKKDKSIIYTLDRWKCDIDLIVSSLRNENSYKEFLEIFEAGLKEPEAKKLRKIIERGEDPDAIKTTNRFRKILGLKPFPKRK